MTIEQTPQEREKELNDYFGYDRQEIKINYLEV